MNKINFEIAAPTEGEGIEDLNLQKYEDEILDYLHDAFGSDVSVTVDVFQHDGTGQDKITVDADNPDTEYELEQRAEMLLPEALDQAFQNEENYK